MPILHVIIIRDIDSVHRDVVGPFDGRQAADDFVANNRAKLEKKYGDYAVFIIEPMTPPSCIFK